LITAFVRATTVTLDPLVGIRDGILRGIAHALSNRVAALSGVAGLVDFGDLSSERLSRALGSEVSQLGQLVELVRLLPSDAHAPGEAIELQTLLPVVVALHALHADLRDVACTVHHEREALPVHLGRSTFVYALLVLLDTAKRDALRGRGSVAVTYGGDAAWVTIAVDSDFPAQPTTGDSTPDADTVRQRVGALLAQIDPSLGVAVARHGDGRGNGLRLSMRLPTLLEVRRRERGPSAE
jgi:hypothetical protein